MTRPKNLTCPYRTPSGRDTLSAFVLASLVFAVFANSIPGAFVWDDEQFIFRNAYVLDPGHWVDLWTKNIVAGAGLVSNLYRPVQALTHKFDFLAWGLDPAGHRLTNVFLHMAAAAALYFLFRRLLSPSAALVSSAFFALHPIQTEAVAYVSGRGDILAILFAASGLLLFEKSRALSLIFAALAMGSKESHALFPVFLGLFLFAGRRPFFWKDHAPYWALSAAYVTLRLTLLNFKNTLNFYSQPNILTEEPLARLWTYCTTIPKGVLLWLWPSDLHHERSWPVFASPAAAPVMLGAAFILLTLFLAWRLRRRNPLVTAGILWFYAATFPTSNLAVLINAIFYDHWFILPGIGLCLVLGAVAEQLTCPRRTGSGRDTLAVLGLAVWTGVSAGATVRYNLIWRTPVSLYSYILEREPQSAKISSNLGMALADSGNVAASIDYYKRAIALSDEFPQTHHNLGMSYLALGRVDEAEKEYRRAAEMDPRFFHSRLYLGMIAANRGDLDAARDCFRRVLEIYPHSRPAKAALKRLGQT